MPITSSAAAWDGPAQRDGCRAVVEVHTLSFGDPISFTYRAPIGLDIQALAAQRAASLLTQLQDEEAEAILGTDASFTLRHQTGSQFAARMRERFRTAEQQEACRLAWWLIRRLVATDLSDAQCRTAFGITLVQWTAIRTTHLQPKHDAYAAMLASTGE